MTSNNSNDSNSQAFREFARIWAEPLRSWLRHHGTKDPATQDEIIQLVQVKMWKHGLDHPSPSLVWHLAKQAHIDHIRSQKRRSRLRSLEDVDPSSLFHHASSSTANEVSAIDLHELCAVVAKELNRMPKTNAAIIYRRFFHGETLATIGRSLGRAEGTISRDLAAILKELAQRPTLKSFVA